MYRVHVRYSYSQAIIFGGCVGVVHAANSSNECVGWTLEVEGRFKFVDGIFPLAVHPVPLVNLNR